MKDHSSGKIYRQAYDKLILSPGSYPTKPPIPGIDSENIFTIGTIPNADSIIERIRGEDVYKAVVIGGGFIGLEMAENLQNRGLEVSIVELLNQVLPPLDPEMAVQIHSHLEEKGVDLYLGTTIVRFVEDTDGIIMKFKGDKEIRSGLVVLATGVKPEVHLAIEAGLEIGVHGGIQVNDRLETSDPDIFAVGDAVEITHYVTGKSTLIPLAGPAVKQARIAADNVFGRDSRYHGTQGTSVVKIFDLTAGFTGANEKLLRAANIPYKKTYLYPASHAVYYPGAHFLSMKLLFGPDEGKILGAQIIGAAGVDKRIDVLATAIRAGMTVYDLEELELAYAPPYSSVKDPLNMAGYVAANDLRGDVDVIHAAELQDLDLDSNIILDVRTKREYDEGHIKGAKHIPLDDLRERFNEVSGEMPIILYCETGLRSYYAYRILKQRRLKVFNLSGGLESYYAS